MKADISIERTHAIGRAAAKAKAHDLASGLAAKYKLDCLLTDSGATLKGGGVAEGIITVTETTVTVEVALPLYAMIMKGAIEKGISDALDAQLR